MNFDNYNLIALIKHGSHLYGLNNENSDTDYYGIYCPSKEDFYTNRNLKTISFSTGSDKSKNTKEDVDLTLIPLHCFIYNLMIGSIKELDAIHAYEEVTLFETGVWKTLKQNRESFYTVNILNFARKYVNNQTAKYASKGSRLHSIKLMIELFEKTKTHERIKDIWETIPEIDHVHKNENETLKNVKICGKVFQETITCKEATDRLKKQFNSFGQRAIDAEKNQNIDWKAVSHSIRTSYQILDLLNKGDFEFPFTGQQKELLLKIKNGKLNYKKDVDPMLNELYDLLTRKENENFLKEKDDNLFITETVKYTEECLKNPHFVNITNLIAKGDLVKK